MSTVIVSCKLSNGIYLEVGENRVLINGFSRGICDENGFGLTSGVDKDMWDAWLTENKDRDLVKNGLIFAHEKQSSAKAESKEKADLKSKTEPMKQVDEKIKPADK